ncbi:zinc finger, CCHC-type containing protein [Tanacetum coccineum]
MPAETDIRLSLATHSYIYPLGIVEDILVEIAEHVYPVDFVILDSKENEKRPFILGTPFLTTAKAKIKFDKGTITLTSGKSKEEKIKLHLEREMKFNKWRRKSYKGKHPTLITTKEEMDDEGEVTDRIVEKPIYLLKDKQIPSVGIFDELLEAFDGIYTWMGSFEKTDKDYEPTPTSLKEILSQKPGDDIIGSTHDSRTTHSQDGVN